MLYPLSYGGGWIQVLLRWRFIASPSCYPAVPAMLPELPFAPKLTSVLQRHMLSGPIGRIPMSTARTSLRTT